VQGSVEETGNRYQVTVRLIDGASAWISSERAFERPAASALDIRDSLAPRVAEFLRERLGEEVHLREARAERAACGVASFSGRNKHERTPARCSKVTALVPRTRSFRLGDSLATEAQRLDPGWAEPVALRASHRILAGPSRLQCRAREPLIERGLAVRGRALKIDPRKPGCARGPGHLALPAIPTAPCSGRPTASADLLRRPKRTYGSRDVRAEVKRAPGTCSASQLSEARLRGSQDRRARRAHESDAYLSVRRSDLMAAFTRHRMT